MWRVLVKIVLRSECTMVPLYYGAMIQLRYKVSSETKFLNSFCAMYSNSFCPQQHEKDSNPSTWIFKVVNHAIKHLPGWSSSWRWFFRPSSTRPFCSRREAGATPASPSSPCASSPRSPRKVSGMLKLIQSMAYRRKHLSQTLAIGFGSTKVTLLPEIMSPSFG